MLKADENPFLESFKDPAFVERYQAGTPLFMPGFFDVHRMAAVLLAERVSGAARILVLGAGGGLEIRSIGEFKPDWIFEGVDPAPEMLKLADRTLAAMRSRVDLVEGYTDDASEGPFDGAVCLLTLHFLDVEERARTVREVCRRLKPGAPFVVAHSSFPQESDVRAKWLDRYEAFAVMSGAEPAMARQARQGVERAVPLLAPDQDADILAQAGFEDVTLFYRAFTWSGWVAYAPDATRKR